MSSIIRILNEQTINQIAAGEVIENPASIVKELVENAMDAGCQHVLIEIDGGGFQKILVQDDGKGMSKDDLWLCVERYATSKILSTNDLFSLKTMGFRGEALASIVSVSKTTISSSLDNHSGHSLSIEGGKILNICPSPHKKGTTVEVSSLFYNVPARKKFQKNASQSQTEINKMVTQLALANPHIRFTLLNQGKEVFGSPQIPDLPFLEALEKKALLLLEKDWVKEMIKIEETSGAYSLLGFIGSASTSRPNKTGQYLFINQRSVSSPIISYAVKEGYGTYLPEKRYPCYILHLSVPSELLDVNVHPQKLEVRLAEEQKIRELVRTKIEKIIKRPSFGFQEFPAISFPEKPSFYDSYPSYSKEMSSFLPKATDTMVLEELPFSLLDPTYEILSVYKSFLFLRENDMIKILDLNQLRKKIIHLDSTSAEFQVPSQRLIFPLTLHFSLFECQQLQDKSSQIHELGLEFHQTGDQTILVESLPSFLEEKQTKDFLHKILEDIEHEKFNKIRTWEEKINYIYRQKNHYSIEEGKALYEKWKNFPEHQSPSYTEGLFIHLGEHEIRKLFSQKN
ncbi:MAG: DNA mismatch repair endonuclease MutL [Rhabdochlamydiaceae bacterium]